MIDEEEDEGFVQDCENCGDLIDEEQYNRTGVSEYCEDCDLECNDPRGHTFGTCSCV